MDTRPFNFIALAQALNNAEMYSKAFEVYFEYVTRNPQLAQAYHREIRDVLVKLNNELSTRGRMEDIFINLEKIIKLYPGCPYICNDIGNSLFTYGFYKEAWAHFEKVLTLSPEFVTAEKNLNSVKNVLVERWHFRMLNDVTRNEAYKQAIQEKLSPEKDKVIDIGTGTGLLALYAHGAGARNIVACDGSETMTELAKSILYQNKITKDIRIINKLSTSMNENDFKVKPSILVTEMFDAGLFGEHVLQMLTHAWHNLLSHNGTVVPNRAEFFIIGAQCDHLNSRYQLNGHAKMVLNLKKKNVHVLVPDETYDCEDVHLQKDIKYVTSAESVLEVNFNDLENIEMHLKRTESYNVELKATEDGIMNMVIGWFNLYLTDTVTITTDPREKNRANAWQQAVFFDFLPIPLKSDDSVKLEFLMNGGHFTMKPASHVKITRVSADIVRFLNDVEYVNAIINGIPIATVYLGQIAEMTETNIVDLSPFPLYGMLLMKRGASSLMCCAKTAQDKKFFINVFKKNSIPLSKVTILVGDSWNIVDLGEAKYHTIFAHFLELGGEIDVRLFDIISKIRFNHLHSGGLVIPANVRIIGQIVESQWLEINNKLNDKNVNNFKMAELVNKYSVSMNYFKDFSTLEYEALTEPVQLCSYLERSEVVSTSVNVIKDGLANAILCSYQIELIKDSKLISTSRPNSFIDGMVFMTDSKKSLLTGASVNMIQIRDEEGLIKLKITEPTD